MKIIQQCLQKAWVSLRSMRMQLTLLVFVLGAITISLSSFVIIQEQLKQAYEHIQTEKQTIAIMAQGSLNRAFQMNSEPTVQEIVAEINAHRGVSSAGIFTPDGTRLPYGPASISHTLAEAFPQAEAHMIEEAVASNIIQFQHNKEKTRFLALVPIIHVPVGALDFQTYILALEIVAPLDWRDAFYARLPFLVTWSSLLVLLMGLVIYFLQTKVAEPTRRLIQNLSEVQARNYNHVSPVRGFTEFEALSDALLELVNQRKANESQLVKLSAAVEQSNEGILITDKEANIEYANKALIANVGYSWEEIKGRNPRIFGSGNTPPETFTGMWKRLKHGLAWRGELYNRRKDGSEYIELQTITPLKNEQGEITHYLGVKQDITEQKSTQERLHFLAYFDPLTHLPNRVSTLDLLTAELVRAKQVNTAGTFLLLNIDRMKLINDARGFEFGNQVLLAVSERLQELVRENISLGHLGADTFCFVLSARYRDNLQARGVAEEFSERLIKECGEPFYVEGEELSLTVSVGIHTFDNTSEAPELVIRAAETAVHNAKEKGGNQCLHYREIDGQEIERDFILEKELREAIRQNQLRCFLQSQVNAEGQLAGAEALVRWQHPERGMVSPAEFIPIAERSDLIIELDKWMLKHALSVLKKWQQQGLDLSISVNISPRHIRRNEFVPDILALIQKSEVRAAGLVLEVTEGLLVENVEESIAKMRQLQEVGIQFAIDDFGTGYSSLAYIRQLPVKELKIDQSFIRGIPNTKGDIAMVRSIITVAQNMELRVVAEGVETQAQAKFCKENGIWAQGYFYDRPLDEPSWRHKWLG